MKALIGFLVVLVLTALLWTYIYKTYPLFVAEEAIAESKRLGWVTEELHAIILMDDYKSSACVYIPWGIVLGLTGAIAGSCLDPKPKLWLSILIGVLLGAAAGAVSNHISDIYTARSEPPTDPVSYWIRRFSLVPSLMVLVAAVVASFGGFSVSRIVQFVITALLAHVFAACLVSFLMGWITPTEQSQYFYPQFPSNSANLLFCVNVLVYGGLVLAGKKMKPATVAQVEGQEGAAAV